MKHYLIYYRADGSVYCRLDIHSPAAFDADWTPTDRPCEAGLSLWTEAGGSIKLRAFSADGEVPGEEIPVKTDIDPEPAQVSSTVPKTADEDDDDEYDSRYRHSPPPWLDEFEYIDWCCTH